MSHPAIPRQRSYHRKLKSGCKTCKARRIKCDETKPVCTRCVIGGRSCSGYLYAPDVSLPRLNQQLLEMQAPVGVVSDQSERRIFHLLRNLTIHQISGAFDQDFWTQDVMQATQSSPAVWHACLALSALHRRLRLSASNRPEDQATARDYYTLALRQYNKAIQELLQVTCKKVPLDYHDKETVLLVSVLFVGICALQKFTKQATLHVKNAVELYYQWEMWRYKNQTGTMVRPKSLLQLVNIFQYQLTDIGGESDAVVSRMIENTEVKISTTPFKSATEAYFEYLPLHFGWPILYTTHDQAGKVSVLQYERHLAYAAAWDEWRLKLEALELKASRNEVCDIDGIRTLRILSDTAVTYFALRDDRTPLTYRRMIPKHREIVAIASQILETLQARITNEEYSNTPVFSFSLSAYEALRTVGLVCPDNGIRRSAIGLLQRWPRRDGLIDGQTSVFIIKAKMWFEEEFCQSSIPEGYGTCDCVRNVYMCLTHRSVNFVINFVDDREVTIDVESVVHQDKGLPGVRYTFHYT